MSKYTEPPDIRLPDEDQERVRRGTRQSIRELQVMPAATLTPLGEFELEDGVSRYIPHGLGRKPLQVMVSPPRGPSSTGRIEEIRDGVDRSKFLVLQANGWGATIKVDVAVM